MKKVVVLLVCAVVLLVGDTVLDKSGIEASLGAKKACDSGNMRGCFNLGVMYTNGDGVEKDFSKAAQLFKKACDGGDMLGCVKLGIMYADGDGVEKNEQKAAELYKKACDGGNMHGCRNLGVMYEKGNGAEKDQIKQMIYINKVCDNNIKLCADILFFALNTNQGILEFPNLRSVFGLRQL